MKHITLALFVLLSSAASAKSFSSEETGIVATDRTNVAGSILFKGIGIMIGDQKVYISGSDNRQLERAHALCSLLGLKDGYAETISYTGSSSRNILDLCSDGSVCSLDTVADLIAADEYYTGIVDGKVPYISDLICNR